MPVAQSMICSECGSVLSAVTFTCVRGEYCKPAVRFYVFNAGRGMQPVLDVNGYATSREAMTALDANQGRKCGWVCREATPGQFAEWNKYNRWVIRDGQAVNAA
jgi:hypothetical protein